MYVCLTTRCNMKCAHCCASWMRGGHMPMGTFKAALGLCADHGEYISLGGGEPTIHPQFWDMLSLAVAEPRLDNVWLATNGKDTKVALRLLHLARRIPERLTVALSVDQYHETIDEAVEGAYRDAEAQRLGHGVSAYTAANVTIRETTYRIISAGRG